LDSRKVSKKICLLGDPAVGKTSLIQRYVYDKYDDRYLGTIGAKVTKKAQMVAVPEIGANVEMTLLIWDIAGHMMFSKVHQSYYKGAEGALIVADLTRKETFNNILNWISELFKVTDKIPILILVNKFDLRELADITEQEMNEVLGKLGTTCMFTSAKTGENVEKAFGILSEFLARQTARKPSRRSIFR
jgi:small GTP-binding protein